MSYIQKGTTTTNLCCPKCKNKLKIVFESSSCQVLSCGKHKFPVVFEIIYLKYDNLAKSAVESILKNQPLQAQKTLLNLRRRLLFPMMFLMNARIQIPFRIFITIMKLFGLDNGWCEYLLNRKDKDSYKISKLAINKLCKGGRVLDFGCGVGQILPLMSRVVGDENVYAIDSSFLNLMIARKFFTNKKTYLICMDGNLRLPFTNNFLSNVVATDSFHYLTRKKVFVSECYRVLKNQGGLSIIQTINSTGTVFGNIRGITPRKIVQILKQNTFKNINILSDNDILVGVGIGSKIGKFVSKINNNEPYSVFTKK